MKRKQPTFKEMLASVLIERLTLPAGVAVRMTADEVLSHYDCHHMHPVALGGDNRPFNLMMMLRPEHQARTAKVDIPRIAKVKRGLKKRAGEARRSRPMPGSKASPWKQKLDGSVERRAP